MLVNLKFGGCQGIRRGSLRGILPLKVVLRFLSEYRAATDLASPQNFDEAASLIVKLSSSLKGSWPKLRQYCCDVSLACIEQKHLQSAGRALLPEITRASYSGGSANKKAKHLHQLTVTLVYVFLKYFPEIAIYCEMEGTSYSKGIS